MSHINPNYPDFHKHPNPLHPLFFRTHPSDASSFLFPFLLSAGIVVTTANSSDTLALLRDITAQREIYARVARTSSDSRALLSSVLQLMDTANNTVAKMEMARNVDMQKLAQQQLQQQQQQPQPSPSIDNSRSSMGVGSSDNRSGGRTVQMVRLGESEKAGGLWVVCDPVRHKSLTQAGINSRARAHGADTC